MTTSTLFLQNLTSIDHAFIDSDGRTVGGSYNASFEVSGNVEPQEQVVVDFGAVKKAIKQIVDGKHYGFDHKLWIIEGYSNYQEYKHLDLDNLVKITTPLQSLILPGTATKILPNIDYSISIAKQVQDGLNAIYPEANIKVKCFLDIDPMLPPECTRWNYFRYTHGLKHSTSWGCQNIAHGHLSYIGVSHKPDKIVYFDKILDEIDGTNFVWDENISSYDGESTEVAYCTEERGQFAQRFETEEINCIFIPTETTIENLVAWVKENYGSYLKRQGATRLYMSEGLCKGAVIDL